MKSASTSKLLGTIFALCLSMVDSAGAQGGDSLSGMSSEKIPLCVYVSSYHQGYAWSDGIERGLHQALGATCEIRQFDMDTKRLQSEVEKKKSGQDAWHLIDSLRPDVVITSDDNAAKYLIVPFLSDTAIPVVFSGINWTVEEYGFPRPNITGIVEVAPIRPMLMEAKRLLGNAKYVAYVGAKTLTESKNHSRIAAIGESLGLEIDSLFAANLADWKDAFLAAQQYDFVIIGSHSGIEDWDPAEAASFAEQSTHQLSLTNHAWMMKQASIGFTKIPEEHGEWAAATAIAILGGVPPSKIPLVTNRKWDAWINEELLKKTGIQPDRRLLSNAKRVHTP